MPRLLPTLATALLLSLPSGVAMAGFFGGSDDKSNAAAQADTAPKSEVPFDLPGQIASAQKLRQDGNLADAVRALSQLMLVAPDDPGVVGEYGKALAQQGDARDAIAFLKRAAQLSPNDWTLYSAMGVAYV
jgi:Flp pilus assembly protein TadD